MAKVYHPEGGPLMTKQSMAAETDINNIMARWITNGIPPIAPGGTPPTYGDFSNTPDFQTALNAVREAELQFMALPAHIRAHCRNDPGEFLGMVFDPSRQAELVKLGLLKEQIPTAAPKPPVVEDAAPVPLPPAP